jgi:hypothetical protein
VKNQICTGVRVFRDLWYINEHVWWYTDEEEGDEVVVMRAKPICKDGSVPQCDEKCADGTNPPCAKVTAEC